MENSEERMLPAFSKHADLFKAIKQLLQDLRYQDLIEINRAIERNNHSTEFAEWLMS